MVPRFRRIGVLGGMGPQATILLQQRLLDAIVAEDDASHIPLIVHMNPQIPSRLDWILQQKGVDPGPVLANMADTLEKAGAEALVMPCNTAHFYASSITDAVSIPLLHMIELAAADMAQRLGKQATIGILASPATREINLFSDTLQRHGLQVLYPSQPDRLLSCIRRIKSAGASQIDHDTLSAAGQDCERRGADCLLVGCSEFSLIAACLPATVSVPVVDSLDVLVTETIAFARS